MHGKCTIYKHCLNGLSFPQMLKNNDAMPVNKLKTSSLMTTIKSMSVNIQTCLWLQWHKTRLRPRYWNNKCMAMTTSNNWKQHQIASCQSCSRVLGTSWTICCFILLYSIITMDLPLTDWFLFSCQKIYELINYAALLKIFPSQFCVMVCETVIPICNHNRQNSSGHDVNEVGHSASLFLQHSHCRQIVV